jgi:hypothetical protein
MKDPIFFLYATLSTSGTGGFVSDAATTNAPLRATCAGLMVGGALLALRELAKSITNAAPFRGEPHPRKIDGIDLGP